jgi:NAD(P)H-dependent FMN reductase
LTTIRQPALVIAGSVRPNRIAVQVAAWIAAIGNASGGTFEVVDLRD